MCGVWECVKKHNSLCHPRSWRVVRKKKTESWAGRHDGDAIVAFAVDVAMAAHAFLAALRMLDPESESKGGDVSRGRIAVREC